MNQRRRPRRTKAVAPRARTLTDYDDSVESTFPEEVEMSNFCTNCGAPLEADARFCTACGTPVAPPIPPQAAPQQQAYQQPAYQAAQQQAYQAAPQPAYQAPPQQAYQAPQQPAYQAPPQQAYQVCFVKRFSPL
ncbi:MAG: zinc ribbon domain-containing protein [Clostridia bacterium]|nr:zinc ribbon domain-containing protein [Clostridia bacterium]